MTIDHLDDDENVKMMRATARQVGLVDLLVSAVNTNNARSIKELLRKALHLLGEEAKR